MQVNLTRRATKNSDLFWAIFAGRVTPELAKISAVVFSYPCGSSSFIFMKQITVVSSHLQKFFRTGVLKICAEFTGKHLCQSLF